MIIKYLSELLYQKQVNDKNVGHEYNKDIETRFREDARTTLVRLGTRKLMNYYKVVRFKWRFWIIFGNPGGGKSWSLVALGGYAVKMGYNVIHYT